MATLRRLSIKITMASLVIAPMALISGFSVTAATAATGCLYTGNCATLTASRSSVDPGGAFFLRGTGWGPGTTVTLNICHLESLHAKVDSSDAFSVSVTIPKRASTGTCVITSTGTGENAKPLTRATSIVIARTSAAPAVVKSVGPTTVPTAHTGEPWASPLYWVLTGGLILGGSGLIFNRRRRSRV